MLPRRLRRTRRPLIALVALVAALAVGYSLQALSSDSSTIGSVRLSSLPPQAAQTLRLIERGGPFPYPRNDGVVFHNAEHRLPSEPDGYYREYTVPTPGTADRGARRIIAGTPGQFWYTPDHYETFEKIETSK